MKTAFLKTFRATVAAFVPLHLQIAREARNDNTRQKVMANTEDSWEHHNYEFWGKDHSFRDQAGALHSVKVQVKQLLFFKDVLDGLNDTNPVKLGGGKQREGFGTSIRYRLRAQSSYFSNL